MSAALVWLARRAGDLRWRLLVNSSWRLGLTSLAMAATAFGTSRWLETLNPGSSRWGLVLNLAVSSMFGLGVFVALESMMRLEAILELQTLAKEVWTTRVRPS